MCIETFEGSLPIFRIYENCASVVGIFMRTATSIIMQAGITRRIRKCRLHQRFAMKERMNDVPQGISILSFERL
jgi:hypothetical protein